MCVGGENSGESERAEGEKVEKQKRESLNNVTPDENSKCGLTSDSIGDLRNLIPATFLISFIWGGSERKCDGRQVDTGDK